MYEGEWVIISGWGMSNWGWGRDAGDGIWVIEDGGWGMGSGDVFWILGLGWRDRKGVRVGGVENFECVLDSFCLPSLCVIGYHRGLQPFWQRGIRSGDGVRGGGTMTSHSPLNPSGVELEEWASE